MSWLSGKQPVSHIVAIRMAMVAAFIFVSTVTLWSDETIGDSLPSSLMTNRGQDYASAQSGLIDQLMASDSALSMPQSSTREQSMDLRQTIANQMRSAMRPFQLRKPMTVGSQDGSNVSYSSDVVPTATAVGATAIACLKQ